MFGERPYGRYIQLGLQEGFNHVEYYRGNEGVGVTAVTLPVICFAQIWGFLGLPHPISGEGYLTMT
jgi:hypothetical protein